jgi:hypothetical protein
MHIVKIPATDVQPEIPEMPVISEIAEAVHELTVARGCWPESDEVLHQHCTTLSLLATRLCVALRLSGITNRAAELRTLLAALIYEALDVGAHHGLDLEAAIIELHAAAQKETCREFLLALTAKTAPTKA